MIKEELIDHYHRLHAANGCPQLHNESFDPALRTICIQIYVENCSATEIGNWGIQFTSNENTESPENFGFGYARVIRVLGLNDEVYWANWDYFPEAEAKQTNRWLRDVCRDLPVPMVIEVDIGVSLEHVPKDAKVVYLQCRNENT